MSTTIQAVVGAVFLSGNSLYPRTDTVLRIEKWEELSATERRLVRTVEYWKSEGELAARDYVRFATRGRKGTDVSPRHVFEGTRYATHEDMVTAYQHSSIQPLTA